MALALYNLLLVLLLLVGLPFVGLWLLFSRRARAGLCERLRPPPRGRSPRARSPRIWVHAASLGEAEAASPVLDGLLERGVPVCATALTLTGRERLRTRFPGLSVRLAPLDLPGLVQRSVERVGARVLVLVETELWPNLIAATCAAGGQVVLVGGRISDRSFRRYRVLRPLFAPALASLASVGARSEQDRRRLVELGARAERTRVIGDLKLDRPPAPAAGPELLAALGPGPFLVAGSTHPGEEEALVQCWRAVRDSAAPDLRLILVPRHPPRAEQVVNSVRRMGARVGRRSTGAADCEVVVVDTAGELGTIYQVADLVFCGGTLAPVGGHNLFEPVLAGKVVVHGAHTENQRSQEALLRPLGVLHAVRDARALSDTLLQLWSDPARNAPAERARPTLEAHRGAAQRALELVLEAYAAH